MRSRIKSAKSDGKSSKGKKGKGSKSARVRRRKRQKAKAVPKSRRPKTEAANKPHVCSSFVDNDRKSRAFARLFFCVLRCACL